MDDPVLHRFYAAFKQRDATAMGACYADDARFSDPAFGELDAAQVRTMWKMLLGRSNDLRITYELINADEFEGTCIWVARYTFTTTGRKVRNVVRSEFQIRDGSITRQQDHFSFWRWSTQALGIPGLLLGWTPLLRSSVRHKARAALERAMKG